MSDADGMEFLHDDDHHDDGVVIVVVMMMMVIMKMTVTIVAMTLFTRPGQ